MIKNYLNERRSWILLFAAIQLLLILIASLDPAVALSSILYFVFLSTVIFIIFLVIRYNKETKFYRQLQEWDLASYDLNQLTDGESPFEKIAEEKLTEQTNLFLREKSQYLKHIEQEKDDLMSWLHEVKTPLTTLQLLIDRSSDESLKSQMEYEWLRIHLLLDQQLHQKRMDTIENDLYMEATPLESVIYPELRALQSWCMQKGIGFDVSLEVSEVLSDTKWLAFIIRQLLTNAVKYSEQADISITSYDENGHMKLQIQDFGRGIDAKDIPRIFEKGFTSTVDHQDRESTGMGLYLVQKTAAALSLNIDVKSAPGKGSCFIITFPTKNEFIQLTGM